MRSRTRRATAIGATAFALAGSAVLGMPGTASAETKTVPCGSTVTAKPGDHIVGTTLLGLPLDLGVVTDGIGQLLNGLCKVTVTVVDAVVAPVPAVGAPVASAVNGAVSSTTNGLTSAIPGKQGQPPAQGKPAPAPGNPQTSGAGGSPSASAGGTPAGTTPIPDSNSPVLTGGSLTAPNYSGLPFNFTTGYAPMRDYSNIPMVNAGLYSPSPGLRYGGQVPGYAPEFGILGQDGTKSSGTTIQNAGQADALPGTGEPADGVGLPVLIAVLSLSGVSAGLVRTWVLRRMATAA
jgi:hypothetical protein